ncbi:MAG TPA: hypothetical protein VK658_23965 [Chryseolinea sp.]|nr:hypothetical protein [Chryseolinea sp.]
MNIQKRLLFLFVLLSSIGAVSAQTKSDVFNKDTEITWLGLDFSHAKLLGDREKFGSESDLRHLMTAWNELILNEPEKYDVAKAVGRSKVATAIDVTGDRNGEVDVQAMFTNDQKDYLHIQPSDIEGIVSSFDFKGKTGIGLVFIVETFSKPNEEGSVFVTFVNMGSKELLFSERLTAEPKGFGMRNFWAGCVFGVLTKMQKKEFENWRKKYYRP